MNIVKAECQQCHAPLSIDLDNMITKCPYCGGQYIIESNQLILAIHEKEETKRTAIQQYTELKKQRYDFILKNKDLAVLIGIFILLLITMFSVTFFDSDAITARKLNRIDSKIISYIDSNQYQKALTEVNKLSEYKSLSSKKDRNIWKDKQENYLKTIPIQQREYDLSDPDNILSPISSKKVTGKTKDEAESIFRRAGFFNISTVMIEGGGGWFKKKNQVEHVVFGDKTDFTTDDYINKNDKITIYYYSK